MQNNVEIQFQDFDQHGKHFPLNLDKFRQAINCQYMDTL